VKSGFRGKKTSLSNPISKTVRNDIAVYGQKNLRLYCKWLSYIEKIARGNKKAPSSVDKYLPLWYHCGRSTARGSLIIYKSAEIVTYKPEQYRIKREER
jgi:hypothetical protein